MVKNPPAIQEIQRCGFNPWIRKIPWRRKWQPTPVFFPGKSHGQRSLVGYIQSMGLQRVGHDLVTESRTHNTIPIKATMNNFCAHTLVYDLSAE